MISTMAVPVSSRRLRIRSRICAWIVTSSAVVGSSAMSSSGSQASAMAIMTRCAMPPDSSCGNALSRRCGSGMPTIRRSSRARASATLPFMFRWILSTSSICLPTSADRVERRRRLLEDHRDPVAADLAHLLVRDLEQVPAVEQDLAGLDPPGVGHQAHDRQAGDALAAARFADQPHDLAAIDVEVDAVDGADDAVARVERGAQARDLEQRLLAALALRACAPRPGRSPR